MSNCVLSTAIAKLSDKLMLCSHGSNQFQLQERALIENLQSSAALSVRSPLSRITVDDGKARRFFCLVDSAYGVVYFCLCNRGVGSSKLIFSYLDSIMKAFASQFAVQSLVDVSTPYKFISFDATIATKTCELEKAIQGNTQGQPFGGSRPAGEISSQLTEVQDIIRTNLDDLVMRGQKLETMQKFSSELREESTRFRKKSAALNRSAVKQYILLGVMVCLLLLYLLWGRKGMER